MDRWMDGGDGGELEPMDAEGRQHCCRVDRDARRESSVCRRVEGAKEARGCGVEEENWGGPWSCWAKEHLLQLTV